MKEKQQKNTTSMMTPERAKFLLEDQGVPPDLWNRYKESSDEIAVLVNIARGSEPRDYIDMLVFRWSLRHGRKRTDKK